MYEEQAGVNEGEASTPGSEPFGRHLRELARAIYGTLLNIRSLGPVPEVNAKPAAGGLISIFLADTSDTLRPLKKRVSAELASLPDVKITANVPPPFEAAEHDDRVRTIVTDADL